MREQEKRIREMRTIQAANKNYLGLSGKFGCIMRFMGQPIYQDGGGMIDTTEFVMPWNEDFYGGNSDMPELDEELYNPLLLGWFFDGTTSGIHLEIKYTESKHELTVHWKGFLVYKEVRGELEAFVPNDEWESKVDHLYERARFRERKAKKIEKEEAVKEAVKEKKSFLQRLRDQWGI